jgi:hypothetical protein
MAGQGASALLWTPGRRVISRTHTSGHSVKGKSLSQVAPSRAASRVLPRRGRHAAALGSTPSAAGKGTARPATDRRCSIASTV